MVTASAPSSSDSISIARRLLAGLLRAILRLIDMPVSVANELARTTP